MFNKPLLPVAPRLLLLALAVAMSAQALLRLEWVWPGLVLYGLAVLVFLRAFQPARVQAKELLGGQPLEAPVSTAVERSFPRRLAVLAVVALLFGLAVFFRVYQLEARPAGLWFDEAAAATRALEILEGQRPPLFGATPLIRWAPDADKKANLYYYYVAFILRVFGVNYWGLKLVSVLPAILSVGVALWLFWRLTNGPTAVVGAFLLAVSHWHVTIGRWGWDEVLMSFLQLLAYALLVAGLKEGKRWPFILGGVSLGLGFYTYPTSYVAFLIVPVFVLLKCLGERSFWLAHRANLAVFFLSAVLVFAPLGWYYLHQPADQMVGMVRFQEINLVSHIAQTGDWGLLGENLKRYLLMFTSPGSPQPFQRTLHSTPGEPQLDFLTAMFFVLGVAHALRHWRGTAHALSLAWLGLGLAVGIVTKSSWGAPNVYRTALLAPVACLFSAEAMVLTWRAWLGWVSPARRWLWYGLAALAAGFILWQNYHIYFHKRAASEAVWWAERVDGGIPERVRALGPASTPVFVDPFFLQEELLMNSWFLNYQPPVETAEGRKGGVFHLPYRFASLFEVVADPQAEGRQFVYICPLAYRPFLRALVPEATWEEERNPFGRPLYAVVRVRQQDLQARLAGLDAEGQRTLADFRFNQAKAYAEKATSESRGLRMEAPEVRSRLAEEAMKASQAALAGFEAVLGGRLEAPNRAAIHKKMGWLYLEVFQDKGWALSHLKQSLRWDPRQPDVEQAITQLDTDQQPERGYVQ